MIVGLLPKLNNKVNELLLIGTSLAEFSGRLGFFYDLHIGLPFLAVVPYLTNVIHIEFMSMVFLQKDFIEYQQLIPYRQFYSG